MSARLPVARAILEGAEVRWTKRMEDDDPPLDEWRSGDGTPILLRREAVDIVCRSAYFDVQVGSDIYLAHPEKEYHLESSFGPLRLPYPNVWMEWQIYDAERNPIEMAAAVSETPGTLVDTPSEAACAAENYRLQYRIFMRIPCLSRAVNVLRRWPQYDVDAAGQYVPGSRKSLLFDVDGEHLRNGCEEAIVTTGIALSLMNCKNVTTQESGRVNIRRSGSDKRRGIPAKSLRYHTIILPGGGSERDGTGASGTHRAAAVHRVRGHFKTFTAAAPLMGKHVGTYWWGWQVRGNKDNGMVVSDYAVAAS